MAVDESPVEKEMNRELDGDLSVLTNDCYGYKRDQGIGNGGGEVGGEEQGITGYPPLQWKVPWHKAIEVDALIAKDFLLGGDVMQKHRCIKR